MGDKSKALIADLDSTVKELEKWFYKLDDEVINVDRLYVWYKDKSKQLDNGKPVDKAPWGVLQQGRLNAEAAQNRIPGHRNRFDLALSRARTAHSKAETFIAYKKKKNYFKRKSLPKVEKLQKHLGGMLDQLENYRDNMRANYKAIDIDA